MFRSALKNLTEWCDSPHRKPLLLRGARQVGKTFLVQQLAAQRFPTSFVKIDFEARPELRKVFVDNLQPHAVLPKLELLTGSPIVPGHSLLFLDEIQSCPDALIALRYFYEQLPELHVVAAGSLLEFALSEVSFPVGRVTLSNVYPMTFLEFLHATGQERAAEIIAAPPRVLADVEHEFLLDEFTKYLLVGGLPEAVKLYAETNSLLQVSTIQKDLARLYEADFAKYAGKASHECLRQVFRAVPQRLTKPVKFSHLSEDFSVPTIKRAVDLLTMAQVISKVPHVNPHGLPLGGSASTKFFKALLVDIGLVHGLSNVSTGTVLRRDTMLDAYRGTLAEQAVGQALLEQTDGDLYTWYRPHPGSEAEVDFIVQKGDKVLPIEVKAGAPGRLRSLHQFLAAYDLAERGYIVSTAPYTERPAERLVQLPIFYAGTFLRN